MHDIVFDSCHISPEALSLSARPGRVDKSRIGYARALALSSLLELLVKVWLACERTCASLTLIPSLLVRTLD